MEDCKCIEELTALEEVKVIEKGTGTDDYAELTNKPSINSHELKAGENTLDELGIQVKGNYATKDELPDTSSFITKEVSDLTNYYSKNETDTKLGEKADKEYADTAFAKKEDITDFIKKDVSNLENYYDKQTIDTKTENFITKAVDDLTNYYKKSETYTQEEVNQRISAIKTGGFKNVEQLPESGEEQYIYLVPAKKTFANNIKDEYIWLTDSQVFEQIGSTQLDLDGYVTDENLTQKLQEYVTSTGLEEKLQEYAKTSQIPSLDNYYTKEETYSNTEVDEKIKEASEADLSAYLKKEEASETYLDKATAGETYATKDEIPDTKGFITEATADGKYASKSEITDFITDSQVDTKLENYLDKTTADSTYAKTSDIQDFITEENVDTKLEDYYTKQDIDGKGYLTEHQDLTDYMKTADADLKYATKGEIPSLDGYAKTEDITKEYATKTEIANFIDETAVDSKLEDYVTNQALEEKHYLTEHQDISKLATKEEVNLKADKTDLDNYTDTETLESTYATKQEIPDTKSFITKDVADLTNYYDKDTIDSKTESFITKTVNDLTNYYLKTETYNQTEIDQKISTVISGGFKKVDQLPEQGESKYIYLVPADKSFSQNIKNEFIWLDDEQAFEQIGSTQLDLEPYATTEALNQKLQDYVTTTTLEQKLSDYDKSTQVDSKIDEETRDLLKTLSRELKPDEEDESGYSAQTLVNVKNKSDATELILEIDNLDVKTNVAVNSVLGTLKGQDLEDRLKVVEGKQETDPTVPSYVKEIKDTDISKWNSALQSESDPTVPSHVKSISTQDIANWNAKQPAGEYITKDVSDLTNYYDQTTIDNKLDGKQPTGNYALKTDIPTAVSKLTNDSGYITNEVDDLTNYYDSSTIDSKLAGKQATGNYALKSELPKVGTLDTTSTGILAESSTESLSGTVKLHKIAKSGSWRDLNNKPNLPNAISQLTNDWLMPATDEQNAITLSTQNPNKFFYTVEE